MNKLYGNQAIASGALNYMNKIQHVIKTDCVLEAVFVSLLLDAITCAVSKIGYKHIPGLPL